MILKFFDKSIRIVHLCKSRWFKAQSKIRIINFSDKTNSLFDFRSGVSVSCENFPLEKTLATERKNRLLYMINNNYYRYSLTSHSPDKHNCQSFVYKIKTGAKQNSEVYRFRSKYGKLGKLIIRIVDSVSVSAS